jgi:hypothetical protein
MPLPKFKQYYQLMIDQNRQLFDQFQPIHDGFAQDPAQWADQFHTQGRRVLDVIRDWERRLCHGTEKGQYAKYSAQLADKFWHEVKQDLPLIDQVGLVTRRAQS